MTRRVPVRVGWVLVAVSIVGLVVYFGVVGFRLADTLGWIGAAVGVAGLGLAVAGSVGERRGGHSEPVRAWAAELGPPAERGLW